MAEAKATKTTKTTEKAAAPKATVKRTVAKKAAAATTAAKETAVKTTTVKKKATRTTAAKTKKAAVVKESISIQFAGKEYTTEQLVKIAKDVWEYDLKKEPADFKEVQLYVKPEEAKAYYVINGTETGSFDI